jgi:MFS family permease
MADRGIFYAVLEPIKREFSLSDGTVGALAGIAFGVTYAIGGVPMGMLADRVNRKRMLVSVAIVWSVLTAAAGLTRSFAALFVARMGVGLAESGASPPTMSMIADIFPAEKRARAMSLFVLGTPLGMGLSFAIAASVAQMWGWRSALLFAGVPGIGLALLALFSLRHPERGATERRRVEAALTKPLAALGQRLFKGRALKRVFMATFLIVVGMAGIGAWMTSYLIRERAMTLTGASAMMSLLNGLGGVSLLIAIPLVEWLGRKHARYMMFYVGAAVTVAAAAALAVLFATNQSTVKSAIAVYGAVHLLYSGIAYAALLNLTPPSIRGTMVGCIQVCANFIGSGLGPWMTGLISDHIGGEHSLRWALTIDVAFVLIAANLYLTAAQQYEDELAVVGANYS